MATILIVEDEAIIALGASMILEDAGHDVVLAHDGEAGLAKARELSSVSRNCPPFVTRT